MSRTVINLDDDLCAQAAEILGTTTKVSTVNAALKELVSRKKRQELLDWLAEGNLSDFADDELRERAWRR
ncbi:type II toxin-antitoxin system VapB family antitoxin [Glycomyces albidus]|jgi:Arc/MetJ family transcription regulator|uniref:Type II toxin-antitoxin system VapB family antitoxin n=1 Tax=Glycomyces albidus TaxID=2656774 RepID=A0A6L5GDP8_9ACTN|nr:type II toxin-antitoxin system VapB family antitoxin [Glycomyces albidus]MQM27809.1 type II toxin-antitoxin system VapB family antitoxin [Glycomyces albidus]